MLPQTFPTAEEQERLNLIQKYQFLYDNKQFEVLGLHELIKKQFKDVSQLVYIAHAIPARISEFYGDFVQGDTDDLVIESTSDNEEEKKKVAGAVDYNDLKEAVYDYAEMQSAIGYVVLLVRLDDGEIVIDEVPQDQYFPQKDGSVIFASYIVKPDARDPKRDLWLYIQHYRLENGTAVIDRSLWTVDEKGQKGEQVKLSSYDSSLAEKEDLKISELPIVRIDNGRKSGGVGKSDYADILPQLAEINERTTHIAIQLLKNLDAKMQGPKGLLDENGNAVQWEVLQLESADQPKAEYILNENPLIEETYKHIEKQAYYISWITAVPMFELLGSTTTPERVESLRIRLYASTRKTARKRAKMQAGIDWALRIGLMLLGVKDPAGINVRFSDVLPKDVLAEAQVEEIKVRNGLSSHESSIKRLEGYDDEQAQKELQVIEHENAVAGINVNNPPQI